MLIHLLVPFYTGSHRQWADSFKAHSTHKVELFTLPGRYWKWRMHGAAVTLAQRWLAQDQQPDLILTTDMLDVAAFLSLTRRRSHSVPCAVYFHENQLAYPWSPDDEDVTLQRDRHYAWINYTTAMSADALFFNSTYNLDSFLNSLPSYLKAFPDFQGVEQVDLLRHKSQMLPLGMSLRTIENMEQPLAAAPVLLWNHRWEYDKDPEAFFRLCYRLREEELDFKLIVLGEQFARSPVIFKEAEQALQEHILHWGYAKDRATYRHWLQQADILPVTSRQDFFGGSVVEAMYANVYPLLPNRLAFPMHVPEEMHSPHLYETEEELFQKTKTLLQKPEQLLSKPFRKWVEHYDWSVQIEQYDAAFSKVAFDKR